MILVYKDIGLISGEMSDIKLFIKTRHMFDYLDDSQTYNLRIKESGYSNEYDQMLRINIINKYIVLSNLEYDILNIHYSMDVSMYSKYTLYQFIYAHPLLKMNDIDEYIRYRDTLDDMCYLDREYRNIVRTI